MSIAYEVFEDCSYEDCDLGAPLLSVYAGEDLTIDAGVTECSSSGYTVDCDECTPGVLTVGEDARIVGAYESLEWRLSDGAGEIDSPSTLTSEVTLTGVTVDGPAECTEDAHVLSLRVTGCDGEVTTDSIVVTTNCCGVEY